MMPIVYSAVAVAVILLAASAVIFWRRRPIRRLKTEFFEQKWHALQTLLADKTKWREAILEADKLLDVALKKKHVKGRSQGERLVKAQRLFTENDSVWFGHKLRNKLDSDPGAKLKKTDVKQALVGIRQALKDLGALPGAKAGRTKEDA